MRPLFLQPKRPAWLINSVVLSLFAFASGGGYILGKKNATAELLDTLEMVCTRGDVLMEFPSGRKAVCLPVKLSPKTEEKFQIPLDKLA